MARGWARGFRNQSKHAKSAKQSFHLPLYSDPSRLRPMGEHEASALRGLPTKSFLCPWKRTKMAVCSISGGCSGQ